MPNWTHRWDAADDTHHWFEYDDSGVVARQASFAAGPPDSAALAAADRSELDWMRAEFGDFGVQLYEATYGIPVGGTVPEGLPVTAAEFERAWREARRGRHFTRIVAGPLPVGLRLNGTVSLIPWGAGITGLFVELGLPVPGFVDMGQLPRTPELWPAVGTAGTYEVLGVRLNCEAESRSRPQARLRPVS
ncbi:hypothetical protein [Streptomyces cavernicola]|uniref:Uncharacterized protein n=1 Tax=Streptomyces cavernicola TaxID=3043613 RepID=A0ABT6SFK1_9ACTN|nr:hypothetical protein [Streptomyces sp. B-S-A6]MDI3406981.1 hypothetical protein [Streptomyces sp. B-S-A6]